MKPIPTEQNISRILTVPPPILAPPPQFWHPPPILAPPTISGTHQFYQYSLYQDSLYQDYPLQIGQEEFALRPK